MSARLPTLLVASGIEDATTPLWGHVGQSLRAVSDMFVFDPYEAERMTLVGEPLDQLRWVLREHKPELAIIACTDVTRENDVRLLLQQLDVPYKDVCVRGISTYCPQGIAPVTLCNTPLLRDAEPIRELLPASELALCADASPHRARVVLTLQRAGIPVAVYGCGWDQFASSGLVSRGPLSYANRGALLRASSAALVVPESPDDNESAIVPLLDAAAAGVPVLFVGDTNGNEPFVDGVDYFHAPRLRDAVPVFHELLRTHDNRTAAVESARNRLASADVDAATYWSHVVPARAAAISIDVNERRPAISVLVSTYNRERYVAECIESILNQTYDDFELLLLDDGSKDGSADIAELYASDPRVRFQRCSNIGQTGRYDFFWRLLTTEARGEFLAVNGSDDVFELDSLARRMEVMRNEPYVDLVHSGCKIIDESSNVVGVACDLDFSYDTSSVYRRTLANAFIQHPGTLIRRSFLDQFSDWLRGHGPDFQFWIDGARTGTYRFLPEGLIRYRRHDDNSSHGPGLIEGTIGMGEYIRRTSIESSSIYDIFPGLLECDANDNDALLAALLQAGNDHLQIGFFPTPSLAMDWYDRAMMNGGDTVAAVRFNRAVAMYMAQDLRASSAELAAALHLDPLLLPAAMGDLRPETLMSGHAISPKPFIQSLATRRELVCWDGSRASTTRIFWHPSWANLNLSRAILDLYFSCFGPNDDVDLVIPTLGMTEERLLELVGTIIPPDRNVEHEASVTIERIDDIYFIPFSRYSLIIDEWGSIPGGTPPEHLEDRLLRLRAHVLAQSSMTHSS
jgi:hypothetical protein